MKLPFIDIFRPVRSPSRFPYSVWNVYSNFLPCAMEARGGTWGKGRLYNIIDNIIEWLKIGCSTRRNQSTIAIVDGIFIKHRQGKSSDAETPFTRPRPIAETTFTPPRPIAQHPFFLQEIDRGDSFSNLRDRPRRLLFQHGSVISRNWSASPIFVKLRESSRTRLTEYIRG